MDTKRRSQEYGTHSSSFQHIKSYSYDICFPGLAKLFPYLIIGVIREVFGGVNIFEKKGLIYQILYSSLMCYIPFCVR